MMTFSYVDINTLTKEELAYLKSINRWIRNNSLTQVYVVKDNDDIKSVFCLNVGESYTDMELCFGTKQKEQNKGYCSFGFYMILAVFYNNPSLKRMLVCAICEETYHLCKKIDKSYDSEDYDFCITNPFFNTKYEELEKNIRDGKSLEELTSFCEDDEVMLNILNVWLKEEMAEELERKRWERNRALNYKKW